MLTYHKMTLLFRDPFSSSRTGTTDSWMLNNPLWIRRMSFWRPLIFKSSKVMKKLDTIPGRGQWHQSYPSGGSSHPQAGPWSYPLKDWTHINVFQTNLKSNLVWKWRDRGHCPNCPRSTAEGCGRRWPCLRFCHQSFEPLWFRNTLYSVLLNFWNIILF